MPRFIEENDQTRARRENLEAIRKLVGNVYPNKFVRSHVASPESAEDTISSVLERFRSMVPQTEAGARPDTGEVQHANSELNRIRVRLAGRLVTPPRVMGKAGFVHLSDGRTRLQIYVRRDDIKAISNTQGSPEVDGWELFQLLDHGDIVGVSGELFVTKTGELSVHARELYFLAKALVPMPDKMHGIHDPELRQRRRYADLIAGSLKQEQDGGMTPREIFERRSEIVRVTRQFLEEHGYVEVETPMLTAVASGAAARPFKTHHKALDITLYARIAPELYLKRLLVGGFERVYELNRNFRNEGISTRHNPEFTMLEFYCAYMDVNGMMDFCEDLLRHTVELVVGGSSVPYGSHSIEFGSRFARRAIVDAVEQAILHEGVVGGRCDVRSLPGPELLASFDDKVEADLIQPTFITDFPKDVSPLSKASPGDPQTAERFELFIGGIEVANGFSELNDPFEQRDRFLEQVKLRAQGNEEAMQMDEDYLRALAYGMPPAAGIGIGIDRFVMLLTNQDSIRDVILFPHLRPAPKEE